MNTPAPVPCETFEHEIADLVDGLLNDVDARRIQLHLATCGGCRAWHAAYASLDVDLGSVLPAPTLGPDFDARLRDRIGTLPGNGRAARAAAADAEHDALLMGLRRDSRRRALLGGLGGLVGAVGVLLLLQVLLQRVPALHVVLTGPDRLYLAGAVSTAAVAAAFAWVISRTNLALPDLARR